MAATDSARQTPVTPRVSEDAVTPARGSDIRELDPNSRRESAPGDRAIRAANHELERRASAALELAIAIALEQRDEALRALERERGEARERLRLIEEQEDAFISLLITDHEQQLLELSVRLAEGRSSRHSLNPILPVQLTDSSDPAELQVVLRQAELEIAELRANQGALSEELAESQAELLRARHERDALAQEIGQARERADECAASLERLRAERDWQLAEADRRVEDTRDRAERQAQSAREEIAELHRDLNERSNELVQAHERLRDLDRQIHSRPPPSRLLEHAQQEAEIATRKLAVALREQRELQQELEALKARDTATR